MLDCLLSITRIWKCDTSKHFPYRPAFSSWCFSTTIETKIKTGSIAGSIHRSIPGFPRNCHTAFHNPVKV